ATPFSGVTVESHARTVGRPTLEFARRIGGRLEGSIRLGTIHPQAAREMNKRLHRRPFHRAPALLTHPHIDVRRFVLPCAPYVPDEEWVEWTVRSAEYAAQRGAGRIALIPVRGGNGELERLEALGHFVAPRLSQLEAALDGCLDFTPPTVVVEVDLWDVDRLP